MRILHVVSLVDDQASYGGTLTVAANQCLELRRRGHDARIVGGWRGQGPPPTRLDGVPARLFPVRSAIPGLGLSGLYSPALLRWVREHAGSFDLGHVYLARDLIPLSVARVLRRCDLPYVVQTHGALPPGQTRLAAMLDTRLTRPALLGARHTFVLTPDERDVVARIAGTTEQISLLQPGVQLPERVPAGTADGPPDVLFLGRLRPSRRVMAFAAAAEKLLADGIEATFSVVGPDGGDLGRLRRFIADRPELAGRLRYEGVLPHHRAIDRLRRADLFVMPSIAEQAYPMSLLEAMAAGVASICTTSCGLAGTLAGEQAAIVANPTDDALYGAMRRMLTDRAARIRISARAAVTAASVFSMAVVAEALEQEYGASSGSAHRPVRRSVLWITPDADRARAEVWDRLRTDVDLTVALRDVRPDALRALLRDRPELVVLDGIGPALARTVARWAGWSGVEVLTAEPGTDPEQLARTVLAGPAIGDPDGSDPQPGEPVAGSAVAGQATSRRAGRRHRDVDLRDDVHLDLRSH
jgi:glycosyltransferase involved in cell wall biosynthesis